MNTNNINNNLDRLDKGWFRCYKFVLVIYLVPTIISTILLIIYLFRSGLSQQEAFQEAPIIGLSLGLNFILLRALVKQLQAMADRDSNSASDALCSFVGYLILSIIFLILARNRLDSNSKIQLGVSIGIVLFIIFGSVKVLLVLNKRESPLSQNANMHDELTDF